jgi:poly(3-hydroxybutyrate) depolymerase
MMLFVVMGFTPIAMGAAAGPRLLVPSSLDGAVQECLWVPAAGKDVRPLLVMLHPWSSGYDGYDLSEWQAEAASRDWHYVQPNFRGANMRPEACGSDLARQDILDVVDHLVAHYHVDEERIYLAGGSGGGHMALVMAGHAPDRWTAVSAWVPITDLAAWHGETKAADRKYYKDLEGVCGGAPGDGAAVDACYRKRSPVYFLDRAKDLPVDINAGIHDGYTGSVPIHHTLDAFNVIAMARGDEPVPEETVAALGRREGLADPPVDPAYGRGIHLRATAGPSRVTIFEGGHEGLAGAACAWLAGYPAEK